ncbi:ANKRD17, partial [Symbiodinium sp. CCMP2456]
TYASSSEPPVDRVPLEGTRLALGDSLRFGFCPWIYRLEDAPAAGDATGKTGEEVRCTSSREE